MVAHLRIGGLYGTAYTILPEDLRADMESQWVSANPDRVLSAEDRERMEAQVLLYQERERTGSPCPETEAKPKEINERRRHRGVVLITSGQIKEIFTEISQASRVHDPKSLPDQ